MGSYLIIIHMKVSSTLIALDHTFDHIPFVSTATNLVDLFQKSIFIPVLSPKNLTSCRYFVHLKVKSFFRCLVLLFPFIGNLTIYFIDWTYSATSGNFSSPKMQKAHELSHQIAQLKATNPEFPVDFGWYYRSGAVLYNVMHALEKYATTGDLSEKIVPHEARSIKEPSKIEDVFKDAIDPSSHGALIQTFAAIKKGPNQALRPKYNSHLPLLLIEEDLLKTIKSILQEVR